MEEEEFQRLASALRVIRLEAEPELIKNINEDKPFGKLEINEEIKHYKVKLEGIDICFPFKPY